MLTPVSHYIAAIAALLTAALPARAQLAVIDEPAIAQLIQQVRALEQEVQTAQSQLNQAREALATMTGGRGMENLLRGTLRNYLPSTWAELEGSMQGGGGLYALVRSTAAANAILTPQQVAALAPAAQRQLAVERQLGALQQAVAQMSLDHASGRFAALQRLIDAIATAGDQKSILDLQARISAELGMLQNEQTKLGTVNQALQAQLAAYRLQSREQIVAGHGNFSTRFQPAPVLVP